MIGKRFGPSLNAYGAEGMGGQEGYCDPLSGIAVGFARSELALMDTFQPQITSVLYDCARKLGHPVVVPEVASWKARRFDR